MTPHETALAWIRAQKEPVPTADRIATELAGFEARHPDLSRQNADDAEIAAYTAVVEKAAMRLLLMDQEAYLLCAQLLCFKHRSVLEAMEDDLLLGCAACLQFGKVHGEEGKRFVMQLVEQYTAGLEQEHWMISKWAALLDPDRSMGLKILWDGLRDLYLFYLTSPEWG